MSTEPCMGASDELIDAHGLTAGHGSLTVPRDISLGVGPREDVVASIGANGAGKMAPFSPISAYGNLRLAHKSLDAPVGLFPPIKTWLVRCHIREVK